MENPPRTAFFDRWFQQRIPGEPAPRFQLRSDAFFVTDHRDQIAPPAAAQHSDQLRQEAGRERFPPDIQIDVSLHRIGWISELPEEFWGQRRASLRVDPVF
jgi:hypothetical protein